MRKSGPFFAHHQCLLILVALTSFSAGYAQETSEKDSIALPDGFRFERDVRYGTESELQRLDILYPVDPAKRIPAIVMIHGGGWYTGGKGGLKTLRMMCDFAKAGYAPLSIDYRLSDEAVFPAAVEDCKRAVRWLRAQADRYGVDPARVGAIGASAGGHLSAMLAVTTPRDGFEGEDNESDRSSAVQASVPICAPFDLRVPLTKNLANQDDPLVVRFLGGSLAQKADAAYRASPITCVRSDLPPMLIIHGTADNRVDVTQSISMADALRETGAPCELILVEGGKHGMDIVRDREVFEKILVFFEKHFKADRNLTTHDSGLVARSEDLRWWRDAKLGLFVHWGPVSLKGQEISWSRAGLRRGLPDLLPGTIPVSEYDRLYLDFNPVRFDATEWVNIARDAGMKYMVFTAKHHDGFCMFDSQLTDYKITNSPYHKDICAELAEACHDNGLHLGFYYSLPDWYHPAFRTDQHAQYVKYLHGQIAELCKNYGSVDLIWFDGGKQGGPDAWDAPRLIQMIRDLQPRVLINNRSGIPADFDTPEQVIGRIEPDRPWESCITLGQQWSWKPNDRIKSAEDCIKLLVRCAGGGGNMMLNVGPMPTGEIEPRQVQQLREIGAWLHRYGESIYATEGGPFAPSYWGVSTFREKKIYVHILGGWEASLRLPPIERTIMSGRLLDRGEVKVVQSGDGITIDVPSEYRKSPVTIVELTLDGLAQDIPYKSAGMETPVGATAKASNVRRNEEQYAPDMAVDESPLTRWATDDGITQAWLEIHLPAPITFDVIMIDEAFGPRIEEFQIQSRQGTDWKTFCSGTRIDRNWARKFPPVTTQDLRMEISKAGDGPTIRDIRFHVIEQ
ncbi:MAG TPA: alpha-L-fucosidase [bacterium]|nr:alpha-L-fucosidase [bacterium]